MTKVYDIDILSKGTDPYDCLIIAPNEEERSAKSLEYIQTSQVISCDFENFYSLMPSDDEINSKYGLGNHTIHIKGSKNEVLFKLSECANCYFAGKSVAFDMTGFSIPDIYWIMKKMIEVSNANKFDVIYTEPDHYKFRGYNMKYHPEKETRERDYKSVKGFYTSGKNVNERLVIQLGFDGELAHSVYNKIAGDASEIKGPYIVNGMPAYTAKLKDISLENNSLIVFQTPKKNIRHAAANNPFINYNTLVDLLDECEDDTMTICSIGSKPMALGASLFSIHYRRKVKVIYPYYDKLPDDFDKDEKAGKTWRYGIIGV